MNITLVSTRDNTRF